MDTQVNSNQEFPSNSLQIIQSPNGDSSGQLVLTAGTDHSTTGVFLTGVSISLAPKSIDELRTQMYEPASTKLSEDLPECILLRKGSPKLNENYYELNCNVCDSLFAVIETKVCRSGSSPF